MVMPLVILGASGHARVIIDAARLRAEFEMIGIIDPTASVGTEIGGLRVLGGEDCLPALCQRIPGLAAVIAIGDNGVRERVEERVARLVPEIRYASVVHPRSVIANDVIVGDGSFIAAGVTINCGARIGRHAVINTNASIDHDVAIGEFAFVGPNAALAGNVRVGRAAFVGIGASVIQGIDIGDAAVIGAGAAVIRNVDGHCVAVGVPAIVISRKCD